MKKIIKENWNSIKKLKIHLSIIIGVFFFCSLIGFFIPASEEITKTIIDFIKELIEQTKGMGFMELFIFIFFNNLKASFIGMIFGIFLGVIPILFAIANGYLLGFVSSIVTKEEGFVSLLKLIPHGIFELPAIFISLALGLKLGMFLFEKESLKKSFLNSIKIFIQIIIPLLFVAALIETGFIFLLK